MNVKDLLMYATAASLGAAVALLVTAAVRALVRRTPAAVTNRAWYVPPAPNAAPPVPAAPTTTGREQFLDAYVASCTKLGFDPELARRDAERIAAETFDYPGLPPLR